MSKALKPCPCGICQNETWQADELKHLPVYVHGSEGIWICPDCDMALTNQISAMRSMACRAKMQQIRTQQVKE